MRSATSADCVGEPPGELTSSATAASPSGANARSSAFSTAAELITERGTGPDVGSDHAVQPDQRDHRTPSSPRRPGRRRGGGRRAVREGGARPCRHATRGLGPRGRGPDRATRGRASGPERRSRPRVRPGCPTRNFGTRSVIFMPAPTFGVDHQAEVVAEGRAHPVVDVAQPDVRPGLVRVLEVLGQPRRVHARRRRPRR